MEPPGSSRHTVLVNSWQAADTSATNVYPRARWNGISTDLMEPSASSRHTVLVNSWQAADVTLFKPMIPYTGHINWQFLLTLNAATRGPCCAAQTYTRQDIESTHHWSNPIQSTINVDATTSIPTDHGIMTDTVKLTHINFTPVLHKYKTLSLSMHELSFRHEVCTFQVTCSFYYGIPMSVAYK